jgi:hypothetical protein
MYQADQGFLSPNERGQQCEHLTFSVRLCRGQEGRMTSTLTVPRLIKRYGGSRLYDPAAGRYVTLADLQEWKARGLPLTVIDVETNQDITNVLLA